MSRVHLCRNRRLASLTLFLAFWILPPAIAEDNKEAERLAMLHALLLQEITTDIELEIKANQEDSKLKLGETADAVLEQVKPSANWPFRRAAVLQLHRWRMEKKVTKALLGLLSDEDTTIALNAARVLALSGRREAIPDLQKVLTAKISPVSSGYDRDWAALALSALGEPLPKDFRWRSGSDEVEKYIKRK